jgi:hypothetical protein
VCGSSKALTDKLLHTNIIDTSRVRAKQ